MYYLRNVSLSTSPAVRLSVAYIVNNSRTKSARKTKIGREIARHTCDRHTSFKVKRSKFKVTRPIYTEAHNERYLRNCNAHELQT